MLKCPYMCQHVCSPGLRSWPNNTLLLIVKVFFEFVTIKGAPNNDHLTERKGRNGAQSNATQRNSVTKSVPVSSIAPEADTLKLYHHIPRPGCPFDNWQQTQFRHSRRERLHMERGRSISPTGKGPVHIPKRKGAGPYPQKGANPHPQKGATPQPRLDMCQSISPTGKWPDEKKERNVQTQGPIGRRPCGRNLVQRRAEWLHNPS